MARNLEENAALPHPPLPSPPLLGQDLAHRVPNIRKTTFSSEHFSLHTILRKSLLSPVFLAVNPFLGTGEYEESLGLIDYLCFVCNVWHPLQSLVSYCRADPRGFSVYPRNLEVAGQKVKNRNNMSLPLQQLGFLGHKENLGAHGRKNTKEKRKMIHSSR